MAPPVAWSKTWSKTQPTIALSSGESELAAVVRKATEGMGMRSVCQDFGMDITLAMRSDATAAIGIVGRDGLGKVRHLATADLWIQYLNMVHILHTFWKTGRTGNWLLHLSVVQEMLSYLAAAGRNLYTKPAYL